MIEESRTDSLNLILNYAFSVRFVLLNLDTITCSRISIDKVRVATRLWILFNPSSALGGGDV